MPPKIGRLTIYGGELTDMHTEKSVLPIFCLSISYAHREIYLAHFLSFYLRQCYIPFCMTVHDPENIYSCCAALAGALESKQILCIRFANTQVYGNRQLMVWVANSLYQRHRTDGWPLCKV